MTQYTIPYKAPFILTIGVMAIALFITLVLPSTPAYANPSCSDSTVDWMEEDDLLEEDDDYDLVETEWSNDELQTECETQNNTNQPQKNTSSSNTPLSLLNIPSNVQVNWTESVSYSSTTTSRKVGSKTYTTTTTRTTTRYHFIIQPIQENRRSTMNKRQEHSVAPRNNRQAEHTDQKKQDAPKVAEKQTEDVRTTQSRTTITIRMTILHYTQPTAHLTKAEQATTEDATPEIHFYTSSSSNAKYFYPAWCTVWQNIAPQNLKGFATLEELQNTYSRTISPKCNK